MTCEQFQRELGERVLSRTSVEPLGGDPHLKICSACRDDWQLERMADGAVASWVNRAAPAVEPSAVEAVMNRWRSEPSLPVPSAWNRTSPRQRTSIWSILKSPTIAAALMLGALGVMMVFPSASRDDGSTPVLAGAPTVPNATSSRGPMAAPGASELPESSRPSMAAAVHSVWESGDAWTEETARELMELPRKAFGWSEGEPRGADGVEISAAETPVAASSSRLPWDVSLAPVEHEVAQAFRFLADVVGPMAVDSTTPEI